MIFVAANALAWGVGGSVGTHTFIACRCACTRGAEGIDLSDEKARDDGAVNFCGLPDCANGFKV
jgi:hypothetical protein